MDEDRPPRSIFAVWRWPRWTLAVIVPLLIISYGLSIGPVVWMLDRGYYPSGLEELLVICAPLEYVVSQSKMVEAAMSWYIGLWK